MKQFITKEQIEDDNLTEKRINEICLLLETSFDMIGEKCSVGKMIEILETKSNYTQQLILEGGSYAVSINPKAGNTTAEATEYHNELCDALWEAVKMVI